MLHGSERIAQDVGFLSSSCFRTSSGAPKRIICCLPRKSDYPWFRPATFRSFSLRRQGRADLSLYTETPGRILDEPFGLGISSRIVIL